MALTERGMDVIALALNDQQHGDGPKLGSADPHMLAAYCFDLMRKLHYMYMAMRLESGRWSPTFDDYGVIDLRSLAAKIYEDTAKVEKAALGSKGRNKADDWEVRARALEGIIQEQWRAIQDDHASLFREILRRDPPKHAPQP